MKIAVIGTGIVGKTLAGKLATLGHQVTLGTRDPKATLKRTEPDLFGKPPVAVWRKDYPAVGLETFAQATGGAELVINATLGIACLEALEATGAANLDGKLLIDVSNPLDFSQGMPPSLAICNKDSLGEQIQRKFPLAKVVKTLNTVNAALMIEPGQLQGGQHTMFVAGNDTEARTEVSGYLKEWFGWQDVLDLGDITNARGMEMLLPLWIRIYGATGNPMFAYRIVR
ncbi:NADPH-dependent F420 reductase [Candidatus Thiosymbion oneisti]|uniref:NADPH-dependent F420 reductase n=1 Tax=Candidatus Thiosymbion oneisti TaxID=589554 RepID=UPI000AF5232D|nr:NAD(P)-binding domain-containing protein [Candidatus Thiosymbion oneisti]